MSVIDRLDGIETRLRRIEFHVGLAVRPAMASPPTPAPTRAPTSESTTAQQMGDAIRAAAARTSAAPAPRPATAKPGEFGDAILAAFGVGAAAPVAPSTPQSPAAAPGSDVLRAATQPPPLPSPPKPPDSPRMTAPSVGATPSRRPVSDRPTVRSTRPAAATQPVKKTPTAGRDIERFVGVSILGRVGVAALLAAAGYFAQWTYGRIPPVGRVTSIYGLAFVLIAAGFALKHRVSRVYLGILWGGGVAAAYMAGFVAEAHYALVGPVAAIAMLAGACALGQFLARRAAMQTLAIVAIVGAAAAPLLVGGPTDARTALLAYLLLVHGWAAFVERRWGYTGVRFVGLFSTIVVAAVWWMAHGRADVSSLAHALAYVVGWTAPEWGLAARERSRGHTDAIVATLIAAVAAAALAPLTAGMTAALGVPLLGYLLALYAVSLAIGRRFATPAARVAGLCSTVLTAAIWFSSHGRADVLSFALGHAYLLAWTAPEWVGALRGEEPGRERSIAVPLLLAGIEAWALCWADYAGAEVLRRGFGVTAAALWGGIALGARARSGDAGVFVRGLARVAGVLLVVGATTMLDAAGASSVLRARLDLAAVVAAGLIVFAGRARLRVGEGAATLAASLGLLFAANLASAEPDACAVLALILPLVLLLHGSTVVWRVGGLLLATGAPFVALSGALGSQPWWMVAALGVSTAIAFGAHVRATRTNDRALAGFAGVLLVVLALAWIGGVTVGSMAALPAPLANAGTVAATFLLAALAAAHRAERVPESTNSVRPLLGGALFALLLATVWREVHDVASRITPADLGRVVETATLVAFATAAGALGRRRAAIRLAMGAGFVFALAIAHGAFSLSLPGGPWTAAAQILTIAAVPAALLARREARGDPARTALAALLLAAVALWTEAWGVGRFGDTLVLANARFVCGAILVAAFALSRRSAPEGRSAVPQPFLGTVLIAIALAVVWKEAHDFAIRTSPRDLGHLVETAALAGFAAATLLLGRRRNAPEWLLAAPVVLAIAAIEAAITLALPGGPWTAAAQVLLIAAPATFAVSRRGAYDGPTRSIASAFVVAALALWIAAWADGRFSAITTPVVNGRFVAGALLVAALVVARRAQPRVGSLAIAPVLAVLAAGLSFAAALPDVLDAVAGVASSPLRRAIVSVYATVHCAAVLAVGFRSRDVLLRWLALGGFAVIVGKVCLLDLANVDTPLRVLVTGALGAVLLGAAYAYARRSKLTTPEDPPAADIAEVPRLAS